MSISQRGDSTLGSRPLYPEEDILHQWRMRRKMELAKERVVTKVMGKDIIKPKVTWYCIS